MEKPKYSLLTQRLVFKNVENKNVESHGEKEELRRLTGMKGAWTPDAGTQVLNTLKSANLDAHRPEREKLVNDIGGFLSKWGTQNGHNLDALLTGWRQSMEQGKALDLALDDNYVFYKALTSLKILLAPFSGAWEAVVNNGSVAERAKEFGTTLML